MPTSSPTLQAIAHTAAAGSNDEIALWGGICGGMIFLSAIGVHYGRKIDERRIARMEGEKASAVDTEVEMAV
jgi:hypothetical protein